MPCHHNQFFLLSISFQAASYFIIFHLFLVTRSLYLLISCLFRLQYSIAIFFLCFLTGFCLNILQAFLFGFAKYAPAFIFISSIITFRLFFLEGCFKKGMRDGRPGANTLTSPSPLRGQLAGLVPQMHFC